MKELLVHVEVRALPDVSAKPVDEVGEHFYEIVRGIEWRGDTDWYTISMLLVDNNYFVLKCECPKFRFTRGELANGKKCKHIEQWATESFKGVEEARSRIAARRNGQRVYSNTSFATGAYAFRRRR